MELRWLLNDLAAVLRQRCRSHLVQRWDSFVEQERANRRTSAVSLSWSMTAAVARTHFHEFSEIPETSVLAIRRVQIWLDSSSNLEKILVEDRHKYGVLAVTRVLYRLSGILMLIAMISACETPTEPQEPVSKALQIVAALDQGPGNITVTPAGEIFVSLHQFFNYETRVARVETDGSLTPFAEAAGLNSVLGLQADTRGVVWLLDNAMRGGEKRRLVGWHATEDRLIADIDLTSVSIQGSFLNDLAVDAERGVAYIADPASGADAALLVVDLMTGKARRVLQGHVSVTPEDIDLVIDSSQVRLLTEGGEVVRPRVGVNPIALDTSNTWLYYGPMHGLAMYRVRTKDLRDAELTAEALAARVERWADKPISDGISVDAAGNVYLGDLANNAIGLIDAKGKYHTLFADSRLSWIDAFSFGPDGYLYTVANQLHRTAVLNAGVDATRRPFLVLRFQPLSDGTPGR